MADPTNYEQFNANVTELVKVVQDALKAAYGLENVSHGQALGLLAGIDDLASAPVGDAVALRSAMDFASAVVAEVGKYGLGERSGGSSDGLPEWGAAGFNGFYAVGATDIYGPAEDGFPSQASGSTMYSAQWSEGNWSKILIDGGGGTNDNFEIYVKVSNLDRVKPAVKLHHSGNTTVDSNGFIKEASPIFRLANTASCAQGAGFVDAGAGMANTEAQGVTAEHVGTGVYEVSGSLGLAADGWQIELPQEPGTGQHLIMAQTEWDADAAVLTVRTFNRQFDVNTASIVPGDPADIPDGRWLDLRLEMPEPETPEEEATP